MNLDIDGTIHELIIEKKNIKNLYIRVTEDLKIKVTCSKFYTKNMVLKILNENIKSISNMIDKQTKKNTTKNKEKYSLLGKPLNIIYKDVKKANYDENNVIVKDDAMLNKWYISKAKEIFREYLDEAYYVFDEKIPYPKLKVRNMKTRWGVCNRKDNSVTLNLELIKKDHKYLNYVVVHELSHFVHFDHSKAFWKTVEKYCPEYKLVRKELKE